MRSWKGRRPLARTTFATFGSQTSGISDFSLRFWLFLEEGTLLEGEEDLHNWGTRRRRRGLRLIHESLLLGAKDKKEAQLGCQGCQHVFRMLSDGIEELLRPESHSFQLPRVRM